jgi:hypothetical protein
MICSVPTSALRGVPLNSRSFASNFSHDGSALPSASVAVQGQLVAHIHVGKGRGRHLELELVVLAGLLVGDGVGHRRRIVGVGHRQAELVAGQGA